MHHRLGRIIRDHPPEIGYPVRCNNYYVCPLMEKQKVKRMQLRITFGMIALLFLAMTGNSQSMTLALEGDEWKGVHEYAVKGKDGILKKESLTFGEYKTVAVDRSWTKGTVVTSGLTVGVPTDEFYEKIITTDHINKKQTLYFSMTDDNGHQSQAYCVTELKAKDFNIGKSDVSVFNLALDLLGPGMESSNISFSKIYDGVSGIGWELFIDNEASQAKPKSYIGFLARSNEEYYTVSPYSLVKSKKGQVGKMPFGSAGFVIHDKEGKPVAAVSIIDKGVIYLMDGDPTQQLLLATACTSLLLRPADL